MQHLLVEYCITTTLNPNPYLLHRINNYNPLRFNGGEYYSMSNQVRMFSCSADANLTFKC